MDPTRWARVKALFEAVLDQPDVDRATFLQQRTVDDASVYEEVDSLLAAHTQSMSFKTDWTGALSAAVTSELAAATAPVDRVGATIGPYRIDARLGEGGMGVVYKAYDTRLQRTAALKLLNARALDIVDRAALLREARHASALNHPHVCTIYNIGNVDGDPYIAMEWIDGESLDVIVAHGGVPAEVALRYGSQIAAALVHAHERGVVHRDLKSANIAITREDQVKLLDFGIARRIDARAVPLAPDTQSSVDGSPAGTLAYVAPEVLRGDAGDERSDIWAFGVVLYELLTGRLPFAGASRSELAAAILRDPPLDLPSAVPSAVRAIVARCLAKEPRERYQRVFDIKADIDAAANRLRQSGEQSIAVLYFENLSATGEHEYLRDGITEDLITELCQIRGLRVFPRAMVLPYRDKPVTIGAIGRELDASYVLAGSIRYASTRVRVAAQLVETSSGHTAWADRYDRTPGDVLDLQEELARSIAGALRITLSPREEAAITRRPVSSTEAYDCYLQARRLYRRGTRTNMRLAAEILERAVQLAPNFALAYAGLGQVYGRVHRWFDSSPESMQKGIAACEQALRLDPQLAEALSARAFLCYAHEQYEDAIRYARLALEHQADCEGAYFILGTALWVTDRVTEVAALADRAIEVSGDDYNTYVPFSNTFKKLGQREREVQLRHQWMRVLEWQIEWASDHTRARALLAINYANLGRPAEAKIELDRIMAMDSDEGPTLLNAACTYATLGLKKDALVALERAVQAGYWHFDFIERDPDLIPLHDEPQFQQLIRRGAARGKS